MLRLAELALFLAPFVAFAAWRFALADRGPSPRTLIVAVGVMLVLIGVLFWYSRDEALPPGTIYVPAQIQDGRIVAGHPAAR